MSVYIFLWGAVVDMDVSKFYHGDYYLEEEVKTMRGKGIASRKKSSI